MDRRTELLPRFETDRHLADVSPVTSLTYTLPVLLLPKTRPLVMPTGRKPAELRMSGLGSTKRTEDRRWRSCPSDGCDDHKTARGKGEAMKENKIDSETNSKPTAGRGPRWSGNKTRRSRARSSKALRIDVLPAADADSECTCINTAKCDSHGVQPVEVTLKIADRVIAIAGLLDPVQCIRTRLDHKSFAVRASASQFSLSVLQCLSE